MPRRVVADVAGGIYRAVFEPSTFVGARGAEYGSSTRERLRELRQLVVVYAVNLALYAGPLTVAGFGRGAVPPSPEWFTAAVGNPAVWDLGYGFLQNSLFLSAATVLTLLTFHGGVVLTFESKGFVRSAYSVIYSTSAYLAGMFTVVWYLSTEAGLAAARQLVLDLQRAFIYAVIDAIGAGVGLPSGRPDGIRFGDVTPEGSALLSVLLVLAAYFFYSLYLGTRINHDTNRFDALFVLGAVTAAPALYVAGSIIVVTAL